MIPHNFNGFYGMEISIYEQYQEKEIGKIECDMQPCVEGYKLYCEKNDLMRKGRYVTFCGAWYMIIETEIYSFGMTVAIRSVKQ